MRCSGGKSCGKNEWIFRECYESPSFVVSIWSGTVPINCGANTLWNPKAHLCPVSMQISPGDQVFQKQAGFTEAQHVGRFLSLIIIVFFNDLFCSRNQTPFQLGFEQETYCWMDCCTTYFHCGQYYHSDGAQWSVYHRHFHLLAFSQ